MFVVGIANGKGSLVSHRCQVKLMDTTDCFVKNHQTLRLSFIGSVQRRHTLRGISYQIVSVLLTRYMGATSHKARATNKTDDGSYFFKIHNSLPQQKLF